jgi:hypothetical protein
MEVFKTLDELQEAESAESRINQQRRSRRRRTRDIGLARLDRRGESASPIRVIALFFGRFLIS